MKMLAFGQQTLAEDQKEQTRELATKRKKERTNPSRERPLPIELSERALAIGSSSQPA